ncbi:MAG: nucleotidyltransferase family protein [Candidatus Krumholzibacteria bacterium]|nr:nucleotidyltransferase family protein [Candidatus Krumholzibacteria bacterium]
MSADRFLLDTLGHFVRDAEGPPPGVPSHAGPFFEKRLSALCLAQHLSPIVSRSLDRLALAPAISRVTAARFAHDAEQQGLDAGRRVRLLGRAWTRLSQSGIPALIMGDALAATDYPRAGLRYVARLELLVDERDAARALEALEAEGFALPCVHPVLGRGTRGALSRRRAAEMVRFHHVIAPLLVRHTGGETLRLRLRVADAGDAAPVERAWERAREVTLGDRVVRAIGVEDHLADLALDLAIARGWPLARVVDIGLVLRDYGRIDWARVAEILRGCGAYTAGALALRHAASTLGLRSDAVPLEPRAGASAATFLRWWRPRGLDYADPASAHAGRFRFGMLACESPATKARWLWGHVAPRRRWIKNLFGARPSPWLWLKFLVVTRDVWPRAHGAHARAALGRAPGETVPLAPRGKKRP